MMGEDHQNHVLEQTLGNLETTLPGSSDSGGGGTMVRYWKAP